MFTRLQNQTRHPSWVVSIFAGLNALLLCSAVHAQLGLREDPLQEARKMASGTQLSPEQNRTGFDGALRCMDRLFTSYGIRDVGLIVEELPDATNKVKVGARDMFISATSRMTTRSRAIRLIPFKGESVVFADRKDFIGKAQYVLQGSVSQLDESVVRRQRDGALCLGPLCIGVASSDSFSALGLDMNVVRTSDLSLEAGATSKNAVLVIKRGSGADGELNFKKFGLNFNFTMSKSEGQSQALRAMIELGSIELYGKLLKIPYWSCLGNDVQQREVTAEVEDWWEGLAGDTTSLVRWLETQMTARGVYKGQIDGVATDPLLNAVNTYKAALGLPADNQLDVEFFRAYLGADHAKVEKTALAAFAQLLSKAPTVAPVGEEAPPAAVEAASPQRASGQSMTSQAEALRVQDRRGPRVAYARGESYEIEVLPQRDGYLYCWLIDDEKRITKFFPPSGSRDAAVHGGTVIVFPGALAFRVVASLKGMRETVACAETEHDLGLDPIGSTAAAVRDLDSLRLIFGRIAIGSFKLAAFDVDAK